MWARDRYTRLKERIDNIPQKDAYSTYIYKKPPKQRMLIGARARAKFRNVPFSITEEDIVIPKKCPVLGFSLEFGAGRNNTPSLDCIVPELGYVPGNVAVISVKANSIKNDMTEEDLLALLKYIRHHKTKMELLRLVGK